MTGTRTEHAPVSRRAILVWIVALLSLASGSALAQTRLERLEVSLWPEYDQPAMLVMLKGFLPIDTTFPATVRLPMPVEAGVPNAVAFRGPDGTMLIAAHSFEEEGDWTYVVLTTQSREVRLEYYVTLDTSRPERRYLFHWPAGVEISEVAYDVLQPLGSSGLEVLPPGSRTHLTNGRTEERADLGPKLRSDEFTIEVSYSKPTADLTAPAQPPEAQLATMPVGPGPPDSGSEAWLLLLVVATVAFGAGFWLGRSRIGR